MYRMLVATWLLVFIGFTWVVVHEFRNQGVGQCEWVGSFDGTARWSWAGLGTHCVGHFEQDGRPVRIAEDVDLGRPVFLAVLILWGETLYVLRPHPEETEPTPPSPSLPSP